MYDEQHLETAYIIGDLIAEDIMLSNTNEPCDFPNIVAYIDEQGTGTFRGEILHTLVQAAETAFNWWMDKHGDTPQGLPWDFEVLPAIMRQIDGYIDAEKPFLVDLCKWEQAARKAMEELENAVQA